jgi:hypothetical protein
MGLASHTYISLLHLIGNYKSSDILQDIALKNVTNFAQGYADWTGQAYSSTLTGLVGVQSRANNLIPDIRPVALSPK